MFRWLSRYVKRIEVFGVGIELREIPPEEATALLSAKPQSAPAQPAPPEGASEPAPVVLRQDYIRVSGTSASSRRTPRELDLMTDGEEIQLCIHAPGGTQPPLWVGRRALEEGFGRWQEAGGDVVVPARTARKEAQVAFIADDSDEIEVQAGWWIWVPRTDLKAALTELGVRVPW
jgi:hypothetical protein